MNADEWNDTYPIGTVVNACPGRRADEGGAVMRTKTRSRAWTLGSGEPVVAVKGYPGGIALTHVTPVQDPRSATPTTLTADEKALFPKNLHGTVIAIKQEWYEAGKAAAR